MTLAASRMESPGLMLPSEAVSQGAAMLWVLGVGSSA